MERFGGTQEQRVRQDQRPGEVVSQPDSRERGGFGGQRLVLRDDRVDRLRLREERHLHRDLECALTGGEPTGQRQSSCLGVVKTLGAQLIRFVGADAHRHPVPVAEDAGQLEIQRADRQSVAPEHLLGGGVVEAADMVAPIVEEVPHLLVGHRNVRRVPGDLRRELVELIGGRPQPAVQRHERAPHGGHPGDEFVDIRQRHGTVPMSGLIAAATSAADKWKAFRAGLDSGTLQRLPGAFNPLVAKPIQGIGFEGVYVSGAVVSADLALPDIGLTTLTEVAGRGQQIARVTDLTVLIDADTGFGEPMSAARAVTVLDTTAISKVVPETNSLTYRGYAVQDLAAHCSFEEVAYLLWYGELPTPAQLELLCQRERAARRADRSLLPLLAKMPDNCHPMDVVRTAISYSARKTRRRTIIRRPRTSRRRCARRRCCPRSWPQTSGAGADRTRSHRTRTWGSRRTF